MWADLAPNELAQGCPSFHPCVTSARWGYLLLKERCHSGWGGSCVVRLIGFAVGQGFAVGAEERPVVAGAGPRSSSALLTLVVRYLTVAGCDFMRPRTPDRAGLSHLFSIQQTCSLHNPGSSCVQAYVSAQQPSAPQSARVPVAYAHPRRPGHSVRTSPEGPQASRRVATPGSAMLPRRRRMTTTDEFRRVMRGGARSRSGPFTVHLLPVSAQQPVVSHTDDPASAGHPGTVGLVVPKTVGNAVRRNRAKRRIRHAIARHPDWPLAHTVVRVHQDPDHLSPTAFAEALDRAASGAWKRATKTTATGPATA